MAEGSKVLSGTCKHGGQEVLLHSCWNGFSPLYSRQPEPGGVTCPSRTAWTSLSCFLFCLWWGTPCPSFQLWQPLPRWSSKPGKAWGGYGGGS